MEGGVGSDGIYSRVCIVTGAGTEPGERGGEGEQGKEQLCSAANKERREKETTRKEISYLRARTTGCLGKSTVLDRLHSLILHGEQLYF